MIKDKAYYDSLTRLVISCAFKVSNTLGCGFLEKVYENSMALELSSAGLKTEFQKPITVYYQDKIVGEYTADLVVEDDILVELKAVKAIQDVHFAQCQNYLKATGLKLGLLINFGCPRVQVRRVANGC